MRWDNLPKSIPIGGVRWKIKVVSPEDQDDHGLTDVDKKLIKIKKADPELMWSTLFHEAIHAALFMGGQSERLREEDNHEESIIRCMENLLWSWLREYLGRKPSGRRRNGRAR